MKRIFFLVFAIAILHAPIYGQSYHTGSLRDGYVVTFADTIWAKIQVNVEDNDVLLKSGNNYSHLHADQLKKVVLVNPEGTTEVYYAAYFGVHLKRFLFTALVDGEVPLLYREGVAFEEYGSSNRTPYFLMTKGSVHTLGKKKELVGLFQGQQEILSDFLRQSKSKLEDEEDLITFFKLGNNATIKLNLMAGEDD